MGLQLHSADFLHEDGKTYCIRRESLDQDFTIYEKRDGGWVDSGLDQAVKDLNFAEFKRLGLLIKTIMDANLLGLVPRLAADADNVVIRAWLIERRPSRR